METLFEIFIEIVGCIAEIISGSMVETVDDSLTNSSSVTRKVIAVLIGLATGAVIITLGFVSVLLFFSHHPIAGFLATIAFIFFVVLFISIMVKLNKIQKEKSYKKK